MKNAMIATVLALLAFAGCKLEDKKDFTVNVPALSQAMAHETRIREEIASCSCVNMGTFKFEPLHISMIVKNDSDLTKRTVLDALKRAGCSDIELSNLAIFVDQRTNIYTLRAEYKTVSGALAGCGIVSYDFDMPNACMRVEYDSMQTAKKNIEMAIAEAGYTANGVTPESVGAKPKDKK